MIKNMQRSRAHAGSALDTVLDRTVVVGYSRFGYRLRRGLSAWPDDPAPVALEGRIAVVTGANSGLGKATATGLARLGARVHLVVRDVGKGERAEAEIVAEVPGAALRVWRCDVSDLADVERFAMEFVAAEPKLDILVHNAGALPSERTETPQRHETTLAIHVLGPLRMTESLLPALAAAGQSRVVFVASGGMYSQQLPVDDLEYRTGTYRGATAYARTKRAQVALLPILAARWAGEGVAVYGMHPGWADTPGVASSLPGFHRVTGPLLRDSVEGADTSVWLAATAPPLPSGRFWHDRRARPVHLVPWTRYNQAELKSVWEQCALAVGLDP